MRVQYNCCLTSWTRQYTSDQEALNNPISTFFYTNGLEFVSDKRTTSHLAVVASVAVILPGSYHSNFAFDPMSGHGACMVVVSEAAVAAAMLIVVEEEEVVVVVVVTATLCDVLAGSFYG